MYKDWSFEDVKKNIKAIKQIGYDEEAKLPKLIEAQKYAKDNYGLNLTDKDPFGVYHPSGTLVKINQAYKEALKV